MNTALPVDEDAVDVEDIKQRMKSGEPPSDVQEYLWRVRLEAECVPDIVVSDVDPRKYDQRQTKNMPALSPVYICEMRYSHGKRWKDRVLKEFDDLRQLLCRWQDININANRTTKSDNTGLEMPQLGQILVPKQSDEVGWMRFFYGKTLSFLDDIENDKTEEQAQHLYADVNELDCNGNPPHLRLILQFDQILTRKLLMYQISWLQTETLSKPHAVWIYALLARLDKPLHAEISALLRQLTQRCCELHKEEVDAKDIKLCLELLTCVSAEYF